MAAIVGPSSNGVLGGPGHHAVDSHADVDATMNAFSQWLSEMKARSNGSLQAMMAEMSVIRDGITSNSADLTEYKRHSISVQQQMQSQLTDLREKLTSAFTEITSLVKQKAATDQELLSEIHALGRQLSMKTAELEALKKSYSATHQQLQHSLVQLQGQLQSTSSEIVTSKRQVQATQDTVTHKMKEVEQLMVKLRDQVDSGGREGNATALAVQEDIAKLHEALTGLSGDFFEHKRLTQQVQSKLLNQVAALEDGRQRSASLLPQDGDYVVSASVRKGFGQPMLKLRVSLLHADGTRAWRRFARHSARHHYLSSQLSPAATCAEVHWGDEAVAFLALLPREAARRTVESIALSCSPTSRVLASVRPQSTEPASGFCCRGSSLGVRRMHCATGFFGCVPPQRYFSSTAHFHLGSARARSPLWASTPFDGSEAARPGDTRLLFKHMYVGKGPAAWKALPEKGDRQESTAGYAGTAFRDSPHNRAAVLRPKKLKRRGRQESTQIDCIATAGEAIKVQVVE
ncbi:Ctsb, partial [Symbiodinium necroappetens]